MLDELDLLSLNAPAGNGQTNDPADIAALDNSLRRIDVYTPPPEYAREPQRYTTEPMIHALESFQEHNGLKVDGYANPGGPTERAINNRLLGKPKGAGLLYDPPAPLAARVGDGLENRREDVAAVQRLLGAVAHMPEDPFDRPHGLIDQRTLDGIKSFQRKKGLIDDGWLAPGGETERALYAAVADLGRANGRDWLQYAERAGSAQAQLAEPLAFRGAAAAPGKGARGVGIRPGADSDLGSEAEAVPAMYDPRHWPPGRGRPRLEGGFSWGSPNRLYRPDPLPGTPRWRLVPIPIPPFLPIPLPRSADDEEPGKTELIPPRVEDRPFYGPDPAKPPLSPKDVQPVPYPAEPPYKFPDREEIRPQELKPEDWILIDPIAPPLSPSDFILRMRGNERTQGRLTGLREIGEGVAKERNDVRLVHIGGARDKKGKNVKEFYAENPRRRELGIKTTAGAAYADLTFEDERSGELYHISVYRVTSGSKPRKEEVEQSIRLAINTTGKTRIIVMVPNVRGDGFVDAEAFKQFLHATLDSVRGAPKVMDMSDPASRERVIRYFTKLNKK